AKESSNQRFVGYLLQSDKVFHEAIRTEEGTKMPRCSWPQLGKLRVDCPAPSQQRRIAEILSTVDEAIEQTEALIAKTQQTKAGLMQDLFTRGVWTQAELDRGDHKNTPAADTAKPGRLRPTRLQAPDLYKESP